MVSTLALLEAAWTGASALFHGHVLAFSSLMPNDSGQPVLVAGILISVLFAVGGLGVLKVQRWARVLTSIMAGLFLLDSAFEVWRGAIHYTPLGAMFLYFDMTILALINGWMLWYLSRAEVRSKFKAANRNWSSLL